MPGEDSSLFPGTRDPAPGTFIRGASLRDGLEQAGDLELARLARGGDESAFAEIVRRYGPRVFSVAARFFRQRERVEEAAQEVFLKAFTQLDSFEGRGSFEGWLTRIATNTCLNLLRAAGRRPELTGWSESKVKVQAFRARRRMREAVERLLGRARARRDESLESAGER